MDLVVPAPAQPRESHAVVLFCYLTSRIGGEDLGVSGDEAAKTLVAMVTTPIRHTHE